LRASDGLGALVEAVEVDLGDALSWLASEVLAILQRPMSVVFSNYIDQSTLYNTAYLTSTGLRLSPLLLFVPRVPPCVCRRLYSNIVVVARLRG
jgi:hypothetical protein